MFNELFQHIEKGSIMSLTPLVPDVLSAVKDSLQRGAGTGLLVPFLKKLETSCPQVIGGHVTTIVELYLDWECFNLKGVYVTCYNKHRRFRKNCKKKMKLH